MACGLVWNRPVQKLHGLFSPTASLACFWLQNTLALLKVVLSASILQMTFPVRPQSKGFFIPLRLQKTSEEPCFVHLLSHVYGLTLIGPFRSVNVFVLVTTSSPCLSVVLLQSVQENCASLDASLQFHLLHHCRCFVSLVSCHIAQT